MSIYSIQSTSQLDDFNDKIGERTILDALSSDDCYIELSYKDGNNSFQSYKLNFKDFTSALVNSMTQYVTTEQLDNKIAELDGKYVHKIGVGEETILGKKIFADAIQLEKTGSNLSVTLTNSGISCANISCANLTCTPNTANLTARHALWS